MYQTNQSPIPPTRWGYPFNKMNRSFMMDKKATFEEKYWVYDNVQQQQWTVVEFEGLQLEPESTLVPPSLEEDPNQSSPLPPDVKNASEEDDLDAFIRSAEELAKQPQEPETPEIPLIQQQSAELWGATLNIIENDLNQLTVKQLKEEYKNRWGTRDVSYNNNKKNLINLILELVINGTPQEETDWAAAWQAWSVD